jgi:hypothetical protein
VELLRQRSRTNKFNHQKRLDKGQLLGRLVLLTVKHYRPNTGASLIK